MKNLSSLINLIVIIFFAGCSHSLEQINVTDLGKLSTHKLKEASGLVVSRQNSHVIWVHNDSGDRARLIAITDKGEFRAEIKLMGIRNRDWEDIGIGPGPADGVDYLYVADIGDNDAEHKTKYIYRFPEPVLPDSVHELTIPNDQIETISFRYPDGKRDAEALFVDPLTRDIWVISKREKHVHVYTLPYPQQTDQVITAVFVTTLPLHEVTAADISTDGSHILIKTYKQVHLWIRKNGENIAEALAQKSQILPYIEEPQGEAIAWNPAMDGYYTLSEEQFVYDQHLYYYPYKK